MVRKFIVIIIYFYFTAFSYSFESAALNAELLKCLGVFKSIKELNIENNKLNDIDKLISKAYNKALFVGFLHPYEEEYYHIGLKKIRYISLKGNYELIVAVFSGCKETLKMIHD